MLSTVANPPDNRRIVFAGIVLSFELAAQRLEDEQQHLGVLVGRQPREVKQDRKDENCSEKTAEQDLESCSCEQGGGKRSAFNTHDCQWLVQGLINRICAAVIGHTNLTPRFG